MRIVIENNGNYKNYNNFTMQQQEEIFAKKKLNCLYAKYNFLFAYFDFGWIMTVS